jgi:hypothetical protein
MSKNKDNEALFNLWLSQNLQTAHVPTPEFAQRVVRRMEQLHARRTLRKILLQKRITGALLILAITTVIGLSCCPPVLRRIYSLLELLFTQTIHSFIEPQRLHLFVLAAVLFLLLLLLKAFWKAAASDY